MEMKTGEYHELIWYRAYLCIQAPCKHQLFWSQMHRKSLNCQLWWLSWESKRCPNPISWAVGADDFKSSKTSDQWFSFIQCDEKCTKAYFHMGKAHLALKNYSEVSARGSLSDMFDLGAVLQSISEENHIPPSWWDVNPRFSIFHSKS